MDDVGGVQVSNNRISGYIIGLCVQTPGADVRHNDVSDSCFGAFVDPGIDDAKIRHNHISATNPGCPTDSANGITPDGAVNTEVRHNLIEGQRDAGMAVVDDLTTNPVAVASGNAAT
jgi:nitrous oxidase accessory protein NosD